LPPTAVARPGSCRSTRRVVSSGVVVTQPTKLSTEALLILVSLAEAPKHGYAIQQDVEQLSGRRLGPGTLYGAIARLESGGLIEALSDSGARRPYRLTPPGAKQVRAELESLKNLTRTGMRRLASR
jgi:DNA-binding PadR family transcriptional regulator